MIPFGEWLPDLPALDNPGATNVRNVIPARGSYRPLRQPVAFTDALATPARGGFAALDTEGAVVVMGATETDLYKLSESSWSSVSGASAPYATPGDTQWSFAQFNNLITATNGFDPVQKYDVDAGGTFADLGGSPPNAKYAAVVRNYLVLAGLQDQPNAVHWSAFEDPEGWTIGVDQSDYQDFPDGGWVQGIIGGKEGFIFQERAIVRMTATGDDYVFQFDTIERNRGLRAPGSLVQVGNAAFFLSHDGFYMLQGGQIAPIGADKVDKSFFASAREDELWRMTGVADPINKVVIWLYTDSNAVDVTPNRAILFNWVTNQWADTDLSARLLFPLLRGGYTLEGLDAVSTSLDDLAFPLDSRLWTQGALTLGMFDTEDKIATLTGDTFEATLETREAELVQGRRSFVTDVRPIVDASDVMVSVARRERQADQPITTSESPINDAGTAPLRGSGRYFRAKVRIPEASSWTHAQGVDYSAIEDGAR